MARISDGSTSYTVTKGKYSTKIKFRHNQRGILNELILEEEDNHIKALYQDSTYIIPGPYKSFIIDKMEIIYFDDKQSGVSVDSSFGAEKEKTGKIQYIILTIRKMGT